MKKVKKFRMLSFLTALVMMCGFLGFAPAPMREQIIQPIEAHAASADDVLRVARSKLGVDYIGWCLK